MNALKVLIFLILIPSISHAYRECPADMVLWQAPGMLEPDCICPFGKKLIRKLNNGSATYGGSLFLGRCSPAYSNLASSPYEADPPSRASVQLWLDADDPYNSWGAGAAAPYAPLLRWRDKSINNFTLTPGCNAGAGPYYIYPGSLGLNRVPHYVDFYNIGVCYYTTNISSVNISAGMTIFAVVKLTTGGTAGWGAIIEHNDGVSKTFALLHRNTWNGFRFETNTGSLCQLDYNGSAEVWYVLTAVWNANSTNQLYVNNSLQGNCGGGSAPPATITATTGIGKRSLDTNVYPGQIAELILYNTTLSTSQITNINNYLNTKWNVY